MTSLRDAAQQALEALMDDCLVKVGPHSWERRSDLAITALKAALAEPVECPHGVTDGNCKECYEAKAEPVQECPSCEYNKARAQLWRNEAYKAGGHPLDWEPELMVRPKPLTEEQIHNLYLHMSGKAEGLGEADFPVMFARAVEEMHDIGEKE